MTGMNGIELHAALNRGPLPGPKVVLLADGPVGADVADALDAVFQKPVNERLLVETAHLLLSAPAEAEANAGG